jgi:hypothetical protein
VGSGGSGRQDGSWIEWSIMVTCCL